MKSTDRFDNTKFVPYDPAMELRQIDVRRSAGHRAGKVRLGLCCAVLSLIVLSGCQSVPFGTVLDRIPGLATSSDVAVEPVTEGLPPGAQWNELLLSAIASNSAHPTIVTHQLFLVSAAMYDAYALYTEDALPYAAMADMRRPAPEHTVDNRQAAVSQAAYQMLVYLFPDYEYRQGHFRAYLDELGLEPAFAAADDPAGIGYACALAVIVNREGDGSWFENEYTPIRTAADGEYYTPWNLPDPQSARGINGSEFDPNRWQPLRVANGESVNAADTARGAPGEVGTYNEQKFLTPYWHEVTPFALSSSAQYRPEAPPQHGSDARYTDASGVVSSAHEAYLRQIDEIIELGQTLTDTQKVVAEYWADGPRGVTIPGHWNQIAQGIVERDELNLDDSVKLYFALNAALLDASIAAWDSKRSYDYIRPVSAVRWLYRGKPMQAWAGPDRGMQDIFGESWMPYQHPTVVSSPFPGYVSSHSTFSRAAAEILTLYTQDGRFYDGDTRIAHDMNRDGEPDLFGQYIAQPGSLQLDTGPQEAVVLSWNTFHDAAEQAGQSQLYSGVNIRDSDLRGKQLGEQIGQRAYCKAQTYFKERTIPNFCLEFEDLQFEEPGL